MKIELSGGFTSKRLCCCHATFKIPVNFLVVPTVIKLGFVFSLSDTRQEFQTGLAYNFTNMASKTNLVSPAHDEEIIMPYHEAFYYNK